MAEKIGEVIESSTTKFTADCYVLHTPPPLGSLVATAEGDVEIYGVVSGATTVSIYPGRRPLARGRDEADAESIYRENPQLAKVLRTSFDVLVVGHGEGGEVRHYLPPRPPLVHGFVYLCDGDQVRRFTGSLDFLTLLLNSGAEGGDEVVSACLRRASQCYDDGRAFLVRAGKELALGLGGQLWRLDAILRRIRA